MLITLFPTVLVQWGTVQQLVLGESWGDNSASDKLMVFMVAIFGVTFTFNIKMALMVSDVVSIKLSTLFPKLWTLTPTSTVSYKVRTFP